MKIKKNVHNHEDTKDSAHPTLRREKMNARMMKYIENEFTESKSLLLYVEFELIISSNKCNFCENFYEISFQKFEYLCQNQKYIQCQKSYQTKKTRQIHFYSSSVKDITSKSLIREDSTRKAVQASATLVLR